MASAYFPNASRIMNSWLFLSRCKDYDIPLIYWLSDRFVLTFRGCWWILWREYRGDFGKRDFFLKNCWWYILSSFLLTFSLNYSDWLVCYVTESFRVFLVANPSFRLAWLPREQALAWRRRPRRSHHLIPVPMRFAGRGPPNRRSRVRLRG